MFYRSTTDALRAVSRLAILLFFLIAISSGSTAQDAGDSKVPLKDRMWMATKMYSSIQQYFGHWHAVPDIDLDAEYKKFLDRISATDDRFEFDLAAMEFVASLKNGHSEFYDQWMWRNHGWPVGFTAARGSDGKWIVTASHIEGLAVGDEIAAMDGKPFEEFFRANERYVAGSNEAARVRALFYRQFLFPVTFELTLAGGKKLAIDRKAVKLKPSGPMATAGKMLDGGIAYLKIPSFGEPKFENDAIEFVKQNATARAMIIDVRGNGGGTSPSKLVAALMDRPYRDWIESSSAIVGLFGAYSKLRDHIPAESRTDDIKMLLEMAASLENTQILFGNKLVQPDNPIYKGRLIVLTNFDCASACEDFIMPLRSGGRAEIYGTPTRGSTGQPYMHDFGNGMGFRVSSKRVYLPDLTEFEGVGLMPTVRIEPTAADIRAGKDPVLERAIAALK